MTKRKRPKKLVRHQLAELNLVVSAKPKKLAKSSGALLNRKMGTGTKSNATNNVRLGFGTF